MKQQIIYSRYEYPIGNASANSIFEEYGDRREENEQGITVGGIDIAVRQAPPRSAIILTYDKEADTYMKLKLCGRKDVQYKKINQE